MRGEATREARLKFMKEARLMRKLSHKHIVKILGVAVHERKDFKSFLETF